REHGHVDIEAANYYMLAWCRVYENELQESAAEARAAVSLAQRVDAQRAEMVARLAAGRTCV
ncbi:MAG: hypothetical protein GWO02_00290, partial [Gammaproteobacteria bacterium]|nr:hypothetical protein [Gammaproteobacteria bacterium]